MKILVVDDHVLIRDALRGVLKELKDEAAIIEAPDARHAMTLVKQHSDLQLVLLDLSLPDRDGFEVLAELRELYPAISVVVLSAHNRRENVARALALGALGFIPKSAPRAVMLSALNLIFAGGVYIPPEILSYEHSAPQPAAATAGLSCVPAQRQLSTPDLALTRRQIDVLALMMQGKSNKAICRELGLAAPTVKNHVTAILKALKVTNRTQAALAARSLELKAPRRAR
jgi:DNA-binding NarL/FixJ family response regulator